MGRTSGEPKHPMASPKGLLRGTLLFLNALITLPVFSILYYKILYWGSIYYAISHNNLVLFSIIMAYTLFIILDPSPRRGGWNLSPALRRWFRSYPGFRLTADYFDSKLLKEQDLDPNQEYIFVYHPHGIIGIGACTMLATDACDFEKHFPGIERRSVTLNATFLTPIFREWILALGFISANKETLKQTLASRKSIVLVAGGAAESLHCQRDTLKLYLKKRQGFVRLAMETGKPLVPCLGFGENEIFDTLVTSKGDVGIKGMLYLFQQAFMKLTTVGPPIITNPTPRSVQLSVVVGAPVDMDMRKTVEENHVRYMQAISKLFEKHASQLGYGHVKLEIV